MRELTKEVTTFTLTDKGVQIVTIIKRLIEKDNFKFKSISKEVDSGI